jgi:hypothetical protein
MQVSKRSKFLIEFPHQTHLLVMQCCLINLNDLKQPNFNEIQLSRIAHKREVRLSGLFTKDVSGFDRQIIKDPY